MQSTDIIRKKCVNQRMPNKNLKREIQSNGFALLTKSQSLVYVAFFNVSIKQISTVTTVKVWFYLPSFRLAILNKSLEVLPKWLQDLLPEAL